MSDGEEAVARLNAARQVFTLRWQQTRMVWDDVVARDFEREYIDPLDEQILATRAELERVLQTIARARRQVH